MNDLIRFTDDLNNKWTTNYKTATAVNFVERLNADLPAYEVLFNNETEYALYIDVDLKVESEYFNDELCNIVKTKCLSYIETNLKPFHDKPIIAIGSSHSPNYKNNQGKISFHFHVSNVFATLKTQQLFVKELNKVITSYSDNIWDYIDNNINKELFDTSVYKSSQTFRCVNTSKAGENRPIKLEQGTIHQTIIQRQKTKDDVSITFIEPEPEKTSNPINNSNDKNIELLNIIKLKTKQRTDRNLWMSICSFIINNKLGSEVWLQFCTANNLNLDAEKLHLYDNLKPSNIEIFYLQKLAKESDKDEYLKWYKKWNTQTEVKLNEKLEKLLASPTDYDFALYFKENYGDKFKCVDVLKKRFYQFKPNHLWEKDDSATSVRLILSTLFAKEFEDYYNYLKPFSEKDELIEAKLEKITNIIYSLKKNTIKDHILKEICDLLKDADFEDTLNKEMYIVPFKPNCLINIKTNEISERTVNTCFSYECDANFIPRPFDLNTYNNYLKVDKYFNDLFCGNQQTKKAVVSIFKTALQGKPTRYIYIFSGSGSNGKSLLFKLIKKIFSNFVDTISKLVIVKQKGNYTNVLNTEMEKLQHCRIAFTSEFNDDDELNTKSVKEISGGDPIDLRGMRETNKTIVPMPSLFAVTNPLPIIKFSHDDTDKAIINRLVNVPFNATFENNSSFENEMMELIDVIFDYIMQEGVFFDNITPLLSEEMIFAKNSYINENKNDELKTYIDSVLIDCENNAEDKPIILDDFRSCFYDYIKNKNLRYPVITSSKFTRNCKSFGLEIKESNHKNRIYKKKWISSEENDDDTAIL